MSPQKYVRLFDDLARLAKRKHSGKATRIPYEKPFGNDWDYLLFAQRPGNDPRPDRVAIDDVMRRVHLHEIGDGWHELTAAAARKHLSRTIAQSLLFPNTPTGVDARAAEEIARQTVELLPGARFYTNGFFPPPHTSPSWFLLEHHALMNALVDTGLVAVSDRNIFMIWRYEID